MENEEYYVFFVGGMTIGTKEWYESILPENIATSYEEILEGKMMPASLEQIEFYNAHKDEDYDLYHLFYMLPLTDEEISEKIVQKNAEIENNRKKDYSRIADPLYMGYVKNMALGNDEKATEYYNQWLEAISSIKEQNPYIV